jgi:hypothetical protein
MQDYWPALQPVRSNFAENIDSSEYLGSFHWQQPKGQGASLIPRKTAALFLAR